MLTKDNEKYRNNMSVIVKTISQSYPQPVDNFVDKFIKNHIIHSKTFHQHDKHHQHLQLIVNHLFCNVCLSNL